MIKREVKLETMLARLIERDGYSRNRQPIVDSIHVTPAALSQYVRGRTRPSFDKLLALADFFGVSLDYLVHGEPTSTSLDPAPITRYMEQAQTDMRARANRHADLVAHIGRLLMARIDEVAEEAVKAGSTSFEGLIELGELLRIERYCQSADIVTADLKSDIIGPRDGEAIPGQFFTVVVENLRRGCRYRFLLVGELTTQAPIVSRFREMIGEAVGRDRLHEFCLLRTATWPVAGAPVLYQLDIPALKKAEQGLFAQFSKYLDGTWLGYLNRPDDESTSDMLMAPGHVKRARGAFESWWDTANT